MRLADSSTAFEPMTSLSLPVGAKKFWKKHRTLLVILLFLSVVAASSRILRGALTPVLPPIGSTDRFSDDPRACSSLGTMFENLETLKEVTDLFRRRTSDVVDERETYLSQPSSWVCLSTQNGGAEPTTERLKALAFDLPAWRYVSKDGTVQLRPVSYTSFTTVLGEFQREYECRLSELTRGAEDMVRVNLDLDDPKSYCCSNNACVQAKAGVSCATTASDDFLCGGTCDPQVSQDDVVTRGQKLKDRIEQDKERARTAMLRTIHALRSFEMNYAYAKQLTCFQRASLDLKNELGLLADTTSCMPKIWDAVTSLHDRDDSLFPSE